MKIRKFLSVIAILAMTSLILCSCDTEEKIEATSIPTEAPYAISGFEVINVKEDVFYGTDQYILYDPETYVMYSAFIYSHTRYKEGGITITPMYNIDGSLRYYTSN